MGLARSHKLIQVLDRVLLVLPRQRPQSIGIRQIRHHRLPLRVLVQRRLIHRVLKAHIHRVLGAHGMKIKKRMLRLIDKLRRSGTRMNWDGNRGAKRRLRHARDSSSGTKDYEAWVDLTPSEGSVGTPGQSAGSFATK